MVQTFILAIILNFRKQDRVGVEQLIYSSCLKFLKLNTQAQQREAVAQGRSLSPYRLRYNGFLRSLGTRYCTVCRRVMLRDRRFRFRRFGYLI
ncbi:MAG: hypothetical protein LBJ00_16070 [Planctomycetaceae bacterium]|nr:hypothetical protein [Planctomycetaceae bacterium]